MNSKSQEQFRIDTLDSLEAEGEAVEAEIVYKEYSLMITSTTCNSFFYWVEMERIDVPFSCFKDAMEAGKEEINGLRD
jgi:hypothetical protein